MDNFIKQLRYFANNAFHKRQEVEAAEIVPNEKQEIGDPKIPEDPRKKRKNKMLQCTCPNKHQIKI